MELFSYLAVISVYPVSSEMAEEMELAKGMMELASVSHFLADCIGKMQCLSTVALQTKYICVYTYIHGCTHILCASIISLCCPALKSVLA